MAEDKEGKLKALGLAVDQIEKAFGKGSIMRMGDGVIAKVEFEDGTPASKKSLFPPQA